MYEPKKVCELNLMENRLQPLSFKGRIIPLSFGKSEIKLWSLCFKSRYYPLPLIVTVIFFLELLIFVTLTLLSLPL
jgi:hypothetical protein